MESSICWNNVYTTLKYMFHSRTISSLKLTPHHRNVLRLHHSQSRYRRDWRTRCHVCSSSPHYCPAPHGSIGWANRRLGMGELTHFIHWHPPSKLRLTVLRHHSSQDVWIVSLSCAHCSQPQLDQQYKHTDILYVCSHCYVEAKMVVAI